MLNRTVGSGSHRSREGLPFENLSEISAEVARGDLNHLAPVTSTDEISQLSTNFNKMVEGLNDRIALIRGYRYA
jgi:HAMP domain-containing protein